MMMMYRKLSALRPSLFIYNNLLKYSTAPSFPFPEITEKFPHLKSYNDIYKFSIEQPDMFWGVLANKYIKWQKKYTKTSEHNIEEKIFKWFPDGQLNVCENCVDRHAESHPNKIACIHVKDEPGQIDYLSYSELKTMVCKMANVLLDCGVKSGDRVVIYMPVSPIAVSAMLACARLGAVHATVFAGFSADALASRINDANATTVITTDEAVRGGKKIPLKTIVEEAVKNCETVKNVLITSREKSSLHLMSNQINLDEAMDKASPEHTPTAIYSEHPLFLLYTSGSTGKPKGLLHTSAGYLLYAAVTHNHVFEYNENDVFCCVADIGWITGHTYVVYGPLANGATSVLFESTPIYPDPGRYWDTVARLGVTHFYCAPTALRTLLSYGNEWVQKYDTSTLKVLGSVGEPLTHEAWHWFNDVVGKSKCTLVDTWWQTESGGIVISPRPSKENGVVVPGMPMRPMYGIEPELIDVTGKAIEENSTEGALCIKSIWPGIARSIFGDHKRFIETYFDPYPGFFFSGDAAHRSVDGYYQIIGRMDDVINVSGHRLGTAEVEDVMNDHEEVAETAVIGHPHAIKGEIIYAFVVLKQQHHETNEQILSELKVVVKKRIASYAVPETILIVPNVPKTRSGKIMRRILKKIALSKYDDVGDTSTLADPSVVEEIIKCHKKFKAGT